MTFEAFSSFDEMAEAMREREEAANARVLPCQREVTWGSYWMRPWQAGGETFLIFGHCMTEEEMDEAERRYGATKSEAAETMMRMRSSHARGYRFGRCYSVIEPEGELGDTHISQMFGVITEEQFHQAELFGWDPEHIVRSAWFKALVARAMREAKELQQQLEQ